MRLKFLLLVVMLFLLVGCSEKEESVLINFEAGADIVIDDHTFTVGETLPVAYKEGYSFLGWFFEDHPNARPFAWEDVTEEEITLYAKWEIKEYQIRFFDWDFTLVQTLTRQYGDTLSSHRPEGEFERENHLFFGWQPLPETMPARDIDIYPIYIPVSYKEVTHPFSLTEVIRDIQVYQNYMIFHTFDVYKDIIHIYKIDDPEYKRTIELVNYEKARVDGFLCENNYLVLPTYSDEFRTGKVYVYKFSDENYIKELTAPEGMPSEWFGKNWGNGEDWYLYQNSLILNASDQATDQGAIYIYQLESDNAPRVIMSPDPSTYKRFGMNIDFQDNLIITKAYDLEGRDGAIFIYDIASPYYERIIFGSDVVYGDGFGYKFTTTDTYLLVNAPYQDNERGAMYIYRFDDPDYERKLTTTDAGSEGRFGYNHFVHDDYIVISDIEPSYLDEIHIYRFSDEGYHRVIDETNLPGDNDDRYLWYVMPFGNYFLVNAKDPVLGQGPATETHLFSYEYEDFAELIYIDDNDYTNDVNLSQPFISESGELLLLEFYDMTPRMMYELYGLPGYEDLGQIVQVPMSEYSPYGYYGRVLYFNDDLLLIHEQRESGGRILFFDLDNNNLSHIVENDEELSNYGFKVFFVDHYLFICYGFTEGNVQIFDLSPMMSNDDD